MNEPQVGDEVLCVGCDKWVKIEQGIHGLIPEKGHRFHFYQTPNYVRSAAVENTGPPMAERSHLIGPNDRTRKAQVAA